MKPLETVDGRTPHQCLAPGCQVKIHPQLSFCRMHFDLVPAQLRSEIAFARARAPKPIGFHFLPTMEWAQAVERAISALVKCRQLSDRCTLQEGK
jgi:hypothetical protein